MSEANPDRAPPIGWLLAALIVSAPSPALAEPPATPQRWPNEMQAESPKSGDQGRGSQIVIFGGGYAPYGNQASIEAHAAAVFEAFKDRGPILVFGSPNLESPSVQESDPNRQNELDVVLGILWEREQDLFVRYRPQRLLATSPLTKEGLLRALRSATTSTRGAAIFGVGHGAAADEHNPAAIQLWGREELTVDDLETTLDDARPSGPVAFVLGHCYSGAFTALATRSHEGPARCVLAAVPEGRPAAGCTPDVAHPDAKAYVHAIAQALTDPAADLDGDRRISLLEAHTAARIHDATIDVPVSSVEALLEKAAPRNRRAPPLDRLVKAARLEERAILERLAPSARSLPDALAQKRSLDREASALNAKIERLEDDARALVEEIREALFVRWPELSNPIHPTARELLADHPRAIARAASEHRRMPDLQHVRGELEGDNASLLELERKLARLERWIRSANIVSNELVVRSTGTRAERAALDRLLACERMVP
ncbi:MAG: hypothetical protein HYV07_28535 [Deltaproteobacteria bacterium]|nr:hypothetical protein [Deltaproteobacteria bacterium]